MDKLKPASAFGGFSKDWDGFSITEITDYELISLCVAGGQESAFAKAVKSKLKCTLPAPGTVVPAQGGSLMWTAPGQYSAMLGTRDDRADEALADALGTSGYTVLQSDGWGVLRLSGPRLYDVLERFIALDLRAAADDFAARTSAHHMAVIAVKLLDGSWLLITPRTSAGGFLSSLEHVADNAIG